jgi:hypothetical protein
VSSTELGILSDGSIGNEHIDAVTQFLNLLGNFNGVFSNRSVILDNMIIRMFLNPGWRSGEFSAFLAVVMTWTLGHQAVEQNAIRLLRCLQIQSKFWWFQS